MRHGPLDRWHAVAGDLGFDITNLTTGYRATALQGRMGARSVQVWLDVWSPAGLIDVLGLRLRVWVQPEARLSIAAETVLSRLSQALLGPDLQVGDLDIDTALHIRAPDEGPARRVLARPDVVDSLRRAIADGWTLTLLDERLELTRSEAEDGPELLRKGVRALMALADALEGNGNPAQDPFKALAERYGLSPRPDSAQGMVNGAWMRLDCITVAGVPKIRVQTTIPGLEEMNARVRADGESGGEIGDLMLDRLLHIAAIDPDAARALVCSEPARGCLLELCHGAGARLTGGRIEFVAPYEATALLGLIDTVLTLRDATAA